MLVAVLIVSLVFGLLLEAVTTNLADLGRARQEARALALAEQRAREVEAEIASGAPVEDGVTEGAYEGPDADLRWHITVSAQTLTLPADYPGKAPPSPLFSLAGAPPRESATGEPPPLRLIEVRVVPLDGDPLAAEPFVLLATAPADVSRLGGAAPAADAQPEFPEPPTPDGQPLGTPP